MPQWFIKRYCAVVASVYLYNEYRGYTELDRLFIALQHIFPQEEEFIAAVRKHTDDEHKHYLMFRHYFESCGEMPFVVKRSSGYIDRFIRLVFRKNLDDLKIDDIVADDTTFFSLCRMIMLTELRGMKQVEKLLSTSVIKHNQDLQKIFKIVERDEPSHCYPYQNWLRSKGCHEPKSSERIADVIVHYSLILIRIPLLFLNPFQKRLLAFPE